MMIMDAMPLHIPADLADNHIRPRIPAALPPLFRTTAARRTFTAFFTALFCLLMQHTASAIFEEYAIYGISPTAFSLGGSAVPSAYDTLSFLRNPASIADVNSRNYIFANGSLSGAESRYSYNLISMTQPKKRAMSLVRSNEGDTNRDMFIYTLGFGGGKDKMYYGINLAPFRFKKTYRVFGGQIKTGDGTGFSMDAGIIYYLGPKTKAGAYLSNFISRISSEKDSTVTGNQNLLPQTMALGFDYRLKQNLNLNLSLARFKYTDPDLRSFTSMSLGVEYILPDRGSFRMTGQKLGNVQGNGENDKLLAVGVDYRNDSFDANISTLNKNDSFPTSRAFSLTWKTDGEWLPPARAEKPKTATSTATRATAPLKYEPPLTAAKDDDYVSKSNFDTAEFGVDNEERNNTGTGDTYTEPPKSRRIDISETSVAPVVILVSHGASHRFSDLSGHWSSTYVAPLNSLGFFPFASDTFKPDTLVSNLEYHRQVLLMQLTRVFSEPVTVLFKTREPVSAAATLNSSSLASSIILIKGSYEKSGTKRIILDRNLLSERAVAAGRYSLNVHLTADDDGEADFTSQLTVLDTSIDFPSADLPATERDKQLDGIRARLSALGLSPSYLNSLYSSAAVTRIDALTSLLSALGVSIPSGHDNSLKYSDTSRLAPEQKNAVYLSSMPLASLGFKPLMSGYPDGTFRPANQITNGESAALISRALTLDTRDFGPYASSFAQAPVQIPQKQTPPPPSNNSSPVAATRQSPIQNQPAPAVAAPAGSLIKVIRPGGSSVWTPTVSSNTAPVIAQPRAGYVAASTQVQSDRIRKRNYSVPQNPDSNVRYLVVAKKYLREENARATVDDLERKGLSASTFKEIAPGGPVFYVILGAFQSRADADELAKTQLADYSLEVKRIEPDSETVKSVPLSTRKAPQVVNLNEREVIMNMPSDDNPQPKSQRPYVIQQ